VQPVIALKAFRRIHLDSGASTTLSFDVGPDQLAILNAQMQRTVEPGSVEIRIGSSSADTTPAHLTITE